MRKPNRTKVMLNAMLDGKPYSAKHFDYLETDAAGMKTSFWFMLMNGYTERHTPPAPGRPASYTITQKGRDMLLAAINRTATQKKRTDRLPADRIIRQRRRPIPTMKMETMTSYAIRTQPSSVWGLAR